GDRLLGWLTGRLDPAWGYCVLIAHELWALLASPHVLATHPARRALARAVGGTGSRSWAVSRYCQIGHAGSLARSPTCSGRSTRRGTVDEHAATGHHRPPRSCRADRPGARGDDQARAGGGGAQAA